MRDLHRRDNAFDLLRLLAASAVLYSHSFALLGLPQPTIVGTLSLGSFAVYVFFSISGYLVCQSWHSDPRLLAFVAKRTLRIFPGLLVLLVLTTWVVGPLLSSKAAPDYAREPATWVYFLSNVGIFGGTDRLPGLFGSNPFPDAVNGSLWTLRYEVALYVWLAVAATLVRRHLANALLASALTFAATWLWLMPVGGPEQILPLPVLWRLGVQVDSHFLNFGVFFVGGALLYCFRECVALSVAAAIALVVACGLARHTVLLQPLLWVAVPYACIVAAYRLPAGFAKFTHGADISYGVYIYAFPVQQVISALAVRYGWSWALSLALSVVVIGVLATLSWFLVERPGLALKRHVARPKAAPGTALLLG